MGLLGVDLDIAGHAAARGYTGSTSAAYTQALSIATTVTAEVTTRTTIAFGTRFTTRAVALRDAGLAAFFGEAFGWFRNYG
jgi:hypothetical protein